MAVLIVLMSVSLTAYIVIYYSALNVKKVINLLENIVKFIVGIHMYFLGLKNAMTLINLQVDNVLNVSLLVGMDVLNASKVYVRENVWLDINLRIMFVNPFVQME